MPRPRLRVYHGPEANVSATAVGEKHHKQTVTLQVEDVLPLLADAVDSRRTWLRDFADDEITISSDLYEVLLAYRHYRRPSA